jgi:hypothetical protein
VASGASPGRVAAVRGPGVVRLDAMKRIASFVAAIGALSLLAACTFEAGPEPPGTQGPQSAPAPGASGKVPAAGSAAPAYSPCGSCCDGTGNPGYQSLQTCAR